MVFLILGHAASVIRDKFLVMSTELQDEKSPSELAALWKTVPKANIIEHRSVSSLAAFSVIFAESGEVILSSSKINYLKLLENNPLYLES